MKGVDLFCSSPASTAICSSIDQRSMVRRSHRASTATADHQSSPARLLHNRLKNLQPHVPCSSQLPIIPKPYNNKCIDQKSRKSFSSASSSSSSYNNKQTDQLRRKSSADVYDLKGPPSGSSRYLLSDVDSSAPFIDWLSEEADDHHPHHQRHVVPDVAPVARRPAEPAKYRSLSSNDSSALRTSSSTRSRHQVVVLRVSLHCKGCEGKVRKHLSKMEGVTSFSIDFPSKKVTVIGDVTPLGVLASVSKVKNAQIWPSTTSSPSSPWSA